MRHIALTVLFAAILSAYFALLLGRSGRRLRLGLILFASLAGGGVVLGILMSLFA